MKTSRVVVSLSLVAGLYGIGFGQSVQRASPYKGTLRYELSHGRVVRQDSVGRIYTFFGAVAKNQQVMLGTPYWDYPTWQEGSVQLKSDMPETACQIAYNVVSNEVLCRFNDDTTTFTLKPVAFTIWDSKFVRRSTHGYPAYYRVLYKGDSKLLESVKRQMKLLKPQPYGDVKLIGYFLGIERYYYLQLPNAPLRSFSLTRQSLMRAMGDNVDTKLLPAGDALTVDDVIRVLADYDAH